MPRPGSLAVAARPLQNAVSACISGKMGLMDGSRSRVIMGSGVTVRPTSALKSTTTARQRPTATPTKRRSLYSPFPRVGRSGIRVPPIYFRRNPTTAPRDYVAAQADRSFSDNLWRRRSYGIGGTEARWRDRVQLGVAAHGGAGADWPR